MSYDVAFFRAINGLAGQSVWTDAAFIFGARDLIIVIGALLLAYLFLAWKTERFGERFENVVHAYVGAAVAFVVQAVIGFLWFRARPFAALPDVIQLIEKSAQEKSFPSAHATVSFALAFGIWLHDKKWGWVLLALAACVSLSRVLVGVHYPSDIAVGACVGYFCARLSAPVKKHIEPYLELLPAFRKYKRRDV